MKKQFTLHLFILISLIGYGQVPPQSFNYSSVIRGNNGQALPNKEVSLRLTILSGSSSGIEEYQETHLDTTSQIGVINLQIGNGTPIFGSFSDIDWGVNSYYLMIELDDNGGTNFDVMGTVQFLSVPYSLYCGNVVGNKTNDTSNTNEIQTISISNDTIFLTKGGSIVLPIPESISDLTNDVGYITNPNDNDSVSTNELQVISISNDTIFISDGGFINLPPAYAGSNTDEQQLSISNDTIYLSNGGYVKISATSGHYVGELYGGGIVFWVTQDGQGGLIASLDDLDGGSGVPWGLNGTNVSNCESKTDGAGNTSAIIGAGGNTADAAGLCNGYSGGGFTDWYLPANRELYLLASQDILIDNILDNDGDPNTNGINHELGTYWSSTEKDNLNALHYMFMTGYTIYNGKSNTAGVRAVRTF